MPSDFDIFSDPALESAARDAVRLDEPRALLDRFATLVRESGMPDEATAAQYIVERLRAHGVPVTLHTPDLYISLPDRAELSVVAADGARAVRARPPAFARSTDGAELSGEVCYVPSRYAAGTATLFDTPDAARTQSSGPDPVAGKIVLTEGFSMPGPVQAFERRGAIAQIYIHPGQNIHEGICTSIWGAPTAESISRKPVTPVVCINRPDGEALVAAIERGTVKASVRTWLREGWMRCLLPVVEIRGQVDPDEFLLVHGHYDSWYEGIGDNATGDAALLELARVLWGLRDRLKRSIRIAWWPGHSTGRYAGSTWYADTFADEIDEWCVAQLNIDSPGCAGATAYDEVMWMAEAGRLCSSSIRDALDLPSRGGRPLRAGDYSFNQIGPTGLYMLLSNIPIEERQAARLLRRRWLRRQHRLAHAGRPAAGRRSRDPPAGSGCLPHHDPAHCQRAAVPVRLRRGRRRDSATIEQYQMAARDEIDLVVTGRGPRVARHGDPRMAARQRGARAAGASRHRRTPPPERRAAPDRAHARAAQLRTRRTVRPRSGDEVRRRAAPRGGSRTPVDGSGI